MLSSARWMHAVLWCGGFAADAFTRCGHRRRLVREGRLLQHREGKKEGEVRIIISLLTRASSSFMDWKQDGTP